MTHATQDYTRIIVLIVAAIDVLLGVIYIVKWRLIKRTIRYPDRSILYAIETIAALYVLCMYIYFLTKLTTDVITLDGMLLRLGYVLCLSPGIASKVVDL